MESDKDKKAGFFARMSDKALALWTFVSSGVWSDPRRTGWINLVRTINLSVSSFLNRDIQTQACAMTYRTLLAVVPALAMLLAIGRGFGMQQVLQDELFRLFPAQHTAIKFGINFVDSYLSQTSEGVILGIGIAVLLWTLISLLGNVEDSFNLIWGQKTSRSLWRKISDYTAILLILPILMLCASGISLLMSSTLRAVLHFEFLTPLYTFLLEAAKCIVTMLVFTAAYMLIPNTKVRFSNALISGIFAGVGFLVLQWLFVTGTLYVTRYNAIYGSFAFLPLLFLWIQLVWVIVLAGAVICYSSQNVFAFDLDREVSAISDRYRAMVTLAITTVLTNRFVNGKGPVTARDLMNTYEMPARLVTSITDRLVMAGIATRVLVNNEKDVTGFQLAIDPATLTVGELSKRLYNMGEDNFIANFDQNFPNVEQVFAKFEATFRNMAQDMPLTDIPLPTPVQSQSTNN